MGDGWLRRSVTIGAVVAVVAIAVVAVAYSLGVQGSQDAGTDSDALLMVFECPDEDGGHVAWVALEMDFAEGTLTAKETSAAATVAGTSASTVRDAYPFGGPGAVAAALAGGSAVPPAVGVSADAWAELLGEGSGVTVELPDPVNVFDGERLVQFDAGETAVDGTSACALLVASKYMDAELASQVRRAVTESTAAALLASPESLARFAEDGRLTSSVSERATRSLSEKLRETLGAAEYRAE